MWSLFLFLISSCDNSSKKSEEISVAISEIHQMQRCRERAENKEFYLHQYKAEKILSRYRDDIQSLDDSLQHMMLHAESEYAFQITDYLLQIGKRIEAQEVMNELANNSTLNIHADTTQYLNFLYHQGMANFIPIRLTENKVGILRGYDCLTQCYILSTRKDYKKYRALSMLALSHYFRVEGILHIIKDFDAASVRYINEDSVADSLLAGNLAERSLNILLTMDSPYFIAEAWRQLAICYFNIGDTQHALECLNMAMANPAIDSLPDLKASISEQMSMSYAALDDKHMSDYYRNAYLDLQDSTRQDRQLEARAISLQEVTDKIWTLVWWSLGVFVFLCIITIVLVHMRRKKMRKYSETTEEIETMEEELARLRLQYSNALRAAVEQRSRIAIVNGMLPLIDRMKLAASRAKDENDTNLQYISDLISGIEKQNTMLTQWIKLRHGSIEPKIETFSLSDIFNVISKNDKTFSRQGIALNIEPTDIKVKGDRTLTLFLINTIADNARKATPEGGKVTISALSHPTGNYAEICICDTGMGMEKDQLDHLFEYKDINDDSTTNEGSHHFGLQNCRGIIDRYRKISSQFSVCTILAESTIGKGTTIRFRLPLVVKMLITLVMLSFNNVTTTQATNTTTLSANNTIVQYADSLYNCNVQGHYDKALLYADSCLNIIRKDSTVSSDIRLSVYNETAVAALAMHQWQKYRINNYLYTQLYKECSADTTLTTYCATMERNEQQANYAMLLMLLLIVSLAPIFWFVYLRHVIKYRRNIRQQKTMLKEETRRVRKEFERIHLHNNIADNQLSTLKHETMFYPSRIQQQITMGADISEIQGTVTYYRDLYAMLSTKALNNTTSAFSFPVKAIPIDSVRNIRQAEGGNVSILINEELLSYLQLLLKRHNGNKAPEGTVEEMKQNYIRISFDMPNLRLTQQQADNLFSPDTHNVDFLIMRQILRETGETSLHYGTGIILSQSMPTTTISITLPIKK